ncbi:MAG: type II toxin-antitoxin system Phd/YefM family antitoxin [Chloroflexota bacterium]|nr:type II toxin-antitoxin system Phd/YefM family antitoxin [Chloroflexota bacterium]
MGEIEFGHGVYGSFALLIVTKQYSRMCAAGGMLTLTEYDTLSTIVACSNACSVPATKGKNGVEIKRISISRIKDHWSEILTEVEQGHQIVEVTRRGKSIARLVPMQENKAVDRDTNDTWAALNQLRNELIEAWS